MCGMNEEEGRSPLTGGSDGRMGNMRRNRRINQS
jgi:hypothetical protein